MKPIGSHKMIFLSGVRQLHLSEKQQVFRSSQCLKNYGIRSSSSFSKIAQGCVDKYIMKFLVNESKPKIRCQAYSIYSLLNLHLTPRTSACCVPLCICIWLEVFTNREDIKYLEPMKHSGLSKMIYFTYMAMCWRF